MLKICFFIAGISLCNLFTQGTYAQEYGLRVGVTHSYFSDDFKLKGGNPGLLIGGIVNVDLSDAFQVTGGLDYGQLSGHLDGMPQITSSGAILSRESNIVIHSLEASVLGGYKLPFHFLGDASPFLMGGVAIGYNLGTRDHFTIQRTFNQDVINYSGTENVSAYADDWLPAWILGLRFATPINEGVFSKMLIDVRLRNSFDPPINTYPFTGSPKFPAIRSISFSLGFTF